MQDRGIDLSGAVMDPKTQTYRPLLEVRTARWLMVRIIGLLFVQSRLQVSLQQWLDEQTKIQDAAAAETRARE